MSDPVASRLMSQNISAAPMVNPFGVTMLYSPSATSHNISHLPDPVNINAEMCTVHTSSPPTAKDIAFERAETVMSPTTDEHEKNKNDLMMGASSNAAKSCGMEPDCGVIVESTYVNDGEEPYQSSDDIYRYVNLCALKGTHFTINLAFFLNYILPGEFVI
jgi:hypothetical protein